MPIVILVSADGRHFRFDVEFHLLRKENRLPLEYFYRFENEKSGDEDSDDERRKPSAIVINLMTFSHPEVSCFREKVEFLKHLFRKNNNRI